jgi:hypothetical protein
MSEWTQCPGCNLRFRTRASGACPRCGRTEAQPPAELFDPEAFARRQAEKERQVEEDGPAVAGAVRVAGAILAVHGLLQLSVASLESSAEGAMAVLDPWLAGFDLVVGGILLSGQAQVRDWATTRAALGGIGLGLFYAVAGQRSSALLALGFGAGILLLLVGRASMARAAAGSVAACAAALVAALGTGPFLGFRNPMGAVSAGLNGEVQWVTARELRGERVGFRVSLPGEGWRLAKPETKEESEPEPDGGAATEGPSRMVHELSPTVRRADVNLDVQLMGIRFPPDVTLDPEKAMETMVDGARESLPELMLSDEQALDVPNGALHVLEGTAWVDGQRTAVALGLAVQGRCVIMLSGTTPPRMYPKVRQEILDVYGGLQTDGC